MKKTTWFSALAFLFATTIAPADTVIEFSYNNTKSQRPTHDNIARINSRGTNDYMLVNFNTSSIYSVAPEDKQITNLSSSISSISLLKAPSIRLDIKPAGPGPVIAGYNTKKYRLSANGDYCGTLFASREALKGSAIENMFGTLKTMADKHLDSLGGFAVVIPTCQLARMRLAEKLQHIGAPMRVLDIEGNIDSEITRIIKNAGVEPNSYSLPANFKKVSMYERIDQILSISTKTEQKPRTKTELRQKMRELQRSGTLTAEEREQMKHYREMLRQQ